MLVTQTLEKLHALRLEGMAQALEEQRRQPDITQLDFETRLGLLVERQWLWKENRALATRLRSPTQNRRQPGRHRLPPSPRAQTGADRTVARLAVGPKAPQLPDHRAAPVRAKHFWPAPWAITPAGTVTARCTTTRPNSFVPCKPPRPTAACCHCSRRLARVSLLIIDDFGIAAAAGKQYRDLLEILDDRQGQELLR